MGMACTTVSELETYHHDVELITKIVRLDNPKERLVKTFMEDPAFRAKAEENRAIFLSIMDRLPRTWIMTEFLHLCDEALSELQIRTV
jgi:hypothetical protein